MLKPKTKKASSVTLTIMKIDEFQLHEFLHGAAKIVVALALGGQKHKGWSSIDRFGKVSK